MTAELPPHNTVDSSVARVVYMDDYIDRRLTVTQHHHEVLRAFREWDGAEVIDMFAAKMGNVARLRAQQIDSDSKYPVDFGEFKGD
jgi:hypothetical protein